MRENMAEWSDDELRSAVRAYLSMLARQGTGESYSKAAVRRELQQGALKDRTEASIEYRMRNITAVLDAHGRATLNGYIAADNVGDAVSDRIWSFIREADAEPPEAAAGVGAKGRPRSTAQAERPPLIYFNIGWMKHYAGAAADDPTIGAHGYLGTHKHGAESFNFLPGNKGVLRGYRPPGSKEQTNISRLGAAPGDAYLDGVTVVWMAREPGTGRTLIVGWYRNARVYRLCPDGGMDLNDERHHYSVEARVEDARLLPPVARSFEVPSSRTAPGEGYGQKPTWYGADKMNRRVWAYIASIEGGAAGGAKSSAKPPKNYDPELRRAVEVAAVEHAVGYYKALFGTGCPVISVEKEAKGWDLEVHCGPEPLLVEVKGLLNRALVCELTPNEYSKMMSKEFRSRYVVYVVTNALATAPAVPIAAVFEHIGDDRWQTKDGRELKIVERTGALLSCG
jgi:hypothetical protein